MEARIFEGANETPALDRLQAATPWPTLSIGEFLQLGLFRLAYVTRVPGRHGTADRVIHGADGMAVAVVHTGARAADLADQFGLMLVSVH